MKVLITGAGGFIGRNLTRYLREEGFEVIALVRRDRDKIIENSDAIKVRIGDVSQKKSLKSAFRGIDVVIHLAALFNNPECTWDDYVEVNVKGTENVLETAFNSGVKRVVHCSTIGVALGSGEPPYNEKTPYSPPEWDKYETTKCEGERVALDYYNKKGFPVSVIRPAQVFGPGDRSKVKFYKMVKKGVVVNPGKTMKHLIFVEDLCGAFELVLRKENIEGEVFIIGNQSPTPLSELISVAAGILGVKKPKIILPTRPVTWWCGLIEKGSKIIKIKPPIFRRRRDFFIKSVKLDVSKAYTQLGFRSQIDVNEGVRRTVAWYKESGLL